jgi:hypothetical protein
VNLQTIADAGFLEDNYHHNKLWDANDLIALGIAPDMVFATIGLFTKDGYYDALFWQGEPVSACVAVRHSSLIDALTDHFGIDPEVGRGYNGAGFAMWAQLHALSTLARKAAPNQDRGPDSE